jgi:hypothetical protein
MPTTIQYDLILQDLAGDKLTELARKVFDQLKAHPDGLTRFELLEHIFGPGFRYNAEKRGLANSSEDRKIREAIEELRNNGVPVVSSSGAPGYRLDTSEEAVSAMVAEWQSRVNNLTARIRKAVTFYNIPHEYNPVQKRLF